MINNRSIHLRDLDIIVEVYLSRMTLGKRYPNVFEKVVKTFQEGKN
jgi:hypothetical protein